MVTDRTRPTNGVAPPSPAPTVEPMPPVGSAAHDELCRAHEREHREQVSKWPGEVWQAYDAETQRAVGLLVSERDEPDRVLAFVPHRGGRYYRLDDEHDFARRFAEHPEDIHEMHTEVVLDLRGFARTDSERATPEFLYRLDVCRTNENRRFARRLFPFCRFRLARMVEQHNAMEWSDEEREEYPLNNVGIWDERNGGKYRVLPVAATDVDFTI